MSFGNMQTGARGLSDWRENGIPWRGRRIPLAAVAVPSASALVALAVYASLAPNGFVWGDAPVYAEQIARLDLSTKAVHIGYFILGIAFTRLVPIDTVHALNLLNALLGALSVGLAASVAYTLTKRTSAGVAAAAVLLCLPVVAENSVFAEIYIAQLFFFMLCVQFALWDRPVAAGLAFSAAFLITPSTVLAVPFLVLLRPDRRFLLVAAATAAVLPALVLLADYRDYLWGGQGLLSLQQRDVAALGALPKEFRELGGWGSLLVLAFAGTGLATLFTSARRRLLAVGVVLLWLVPFLVGERYSDVPVQLPLYGMLAVVAGVGFARLVHEWSRSRDLALAAVIALVFAIVIPGATTYRSVQQRGTIADAFRRDVGAMGAEISRTDSVVAKWPSDRIARYYLDGRPEAEWIDYEALLGLVGERERQSSWAQLEGTVTAKRRIWLIDTRRATDYLKSRGYAVSEFRPFIYVAKPGT